MKQQSASYPDAEIRGLIRRWKEELEIGGRDLH
jgi:hypothetical protein